MKRFVTSSTGLQNEIHLTAGKSYEVISCGLDERYDTGKYIEVFDDLDVISKLTASYFVSTESFKIDDMNNFENKVNHPSYYGGKNNPLEVIKIIKHYKLGFCLGNTIKYILRAGKKSKGTYIEDLEKAKFYLEEKINEEKEKIKDIETN